MKWDKAIKKINEGLNSHKTVTVEYHKKNRKYDSHVETVRGLINYKMCGNDYTDIETSDRNMNNIVWIIDRVTIE